MTPPATDDGDALLDRGRSRAVLIGVHDFKFMDPLPAVENNLTDLRAVFTDATLWGISDEHCLMADQPTDALEVLKTVDSFASETEDTLLVYYAGHGRPDPQGDLCLFMPASDPDRLYTTLRFSDLRAAILSNSVQARNRLVILDCCYSGRALEGHMGHPLPDVAIDGSCVLTATSETRSALAPPGERNTAFTGELLRTLKNGILGADEFLTPDAIHREIASELRAKGRPVPQLRNRNGGGAIPVVHNAAYRSDLRQEVSASETNDRIAQLERPLYSLKEIDELLEPLEEPLDAEEESPYTKQYYLSRLVVECGVYLLAMLAVTAASPSYGIAASAQSFCTTLALYFVVIRRMNNDGVAKERLGWPTSVKYLAGRRPDEFRRAKLRWTISSGSQFTTRLTRDRLNGFKTRLGGRLILVAPCDVRLEWAIVTRGTVLARGVMSVTRSDRVGTEELVEPDAGSFMDIPSVGKRRIGHLLSRRYHQVPVAPTSNLTHAIFPDALHHQDDGDEPSVDIILRRTDDGESLAYLDWQDPSILVRKAGGRVEDDPKEPSAPSLV